jgi:hypothetical protein
MARPRRSFLPRLLVAAVISGTVAYPAAAQAVGARPEDPTSSPQSLVPLSSTPAPAPVGPITPAVAPVVLGGPAAPFPAAPWRGKVRPEKPIEYAWWY